MPNCKIYVCVLIIFTQNVEFFKSINITMYYEDGNILFVIYVNKLKISIIQAIS